MNMTIVPLTRSGAIAIAGLALLGGGSLKSSFSFASSIVPVFSTIRRSVSCFSAFWRELAQMPATMIAAMNIQNPKAPKSPESMISSR